MFFANTIEFSKIIGEVNPNFDLNRVNQNIETAALQYIVPVIGWNFYKYCLEIPDNPSPLPEETQLLELLRKTLAYYAYGKSIFRTAITTSSAGTFEVTPKETNPMRLSIGFLNSYEAIENGDRFMDQMLGFLEANRAVFPIWANSKFSTYTTKNLINSVEDFEEYQPLGGSRRAFLIVRYAISNIEELELKPILGRTFFDEIHQQSNAANYVTPFHEELAKRLKKYLAFSALLETLPLLYINIEIDGLTFRRISDGVKASEPADPQRVQYLIDSLKRNQSKWYVEFRRYILQNSGQFPNCTYRPAPEPNRNLGGVCSL